VQGDGGQWLFVEIPMRAMPPPVLPRSGLSGRPGRCRWPPQWEKWGCYCTVGKSREKACAWQSTQWLLSCGMAPLREKATEGGAILKHADQGECTLGHCSTFMHVSYIRLRIFFSSAGHTRIRAVYTIKILTGQVVLVY
jgi:hypothetical protein